MTTEKSSNYNELEKKSITEILQDINNEDKTVPLAIEKRLFQIEKLVTMVVFQMKKGGRLFYMGAGTSGRLGVVDASECPPTYGVPQDWVVGLIAGGDAAIRKAVEGAEDSKLFAVEDLKKYNFNEYDFLIGIAASGRTPYVIGGLEYAHSLGAKTGCVVCNEGSEIAKKCQFPIEIVVGPEYVTGSTRMKSGTAQKLVLNMISTATMIQLGRVKGNKMVDMQLSNEKLVDRGTKMIMQELNIDYEKAHLLLVKHGSVRKAVENNG